MSKCECIIGTDSAALIYWNAIAMSKIVCSAMDESDMRWARTIELVKYSNLAALTIPKNVMNNMGIAK